jgi:hypothetical protein
MFSILVKFEIFTAVTMKNGVFWDVLVTPMKEALSSSETSVLSLGISSRPASVASYS